MFNRGWRRGWPGRAVAHVDTDQWPGCRSLCLLGSMAGLQIVVPARFRCARLLRPYTVRTSPKPSCAPTAEQAQQLQSIPCDGCRHRTQTQVTGLWVGTRVCTWVRVGARGGRDPRDIQGYLDLVSLFPFSLSTPECSMSIWRARPSSHSQTSLRYQDSRLIFKSDYTTLSISTYAPAHPTIPLASHA